MGEVKAVVGRYESARQALLEATARYDRAPTAHHKAQLLRARAEHADAYLDYSDLAAAA